MRRYKIVATCDYGNGRPDECGSTGEEGSFAEMIFNACSKNFFTDIQGCAGCAFEDNEEWEMPCVQCKRISKDYYRRQENE